MIYNIETATDRMTVQTHEMGIWESRFTGWPVFLTSCFTGIVNLLKALWVVLSLFCLKLSDSFFLSVLFQGAVLHGECGDLSAGCCAAGKCV